jgi:hypothetical protein
MRLRKVAVQQSCQVLDYGIRRDHRQTKPWQFPPKFRVGFLWVLTLLLLLGIWLSPRGLAQPATLPDAPSASRDEKSADAHKPPGKVVTFVKRRSRFFPDLATSPGPLSTAEKFELFVDDSVSPAALVSAGVGSAISQASDYPHGYGQGWDAYGKRLGSSLARGASSEFFGTFVLASALQQDPRFFPQQNPTLAGSAKYAVERVFVTRNDQGDDVANWSGLLGLLFAESLANAYWPDEDRSAGETFRRYGISLATRAGGNMFRNYWPVFFKHLRRSPAARGDGKN